jgi:3-methyladenine DNA glycosylase AlkD
MEQAENQLVTSVRADLIQMEDVHARKSAQQFFKEEIRSYGVRIPVVHQISKRYNEFLKQYTKQEVFQLCEMLWASGIIEESIVACNWAYARRKYFEMEDLDTFEDWLGSYVTNWASCDTFCNHTVGALVEKFPSLTKRLGSWAVSENRWLRRGAAVTLIVPARKGKMLSEIFRISDLLRNDSDDLVQKGYGWLLKTAGSCHQEAIFNYVFQNKNEMPRTALRYAIEKMPDELKKKVMQK